MTTLQDKQEMREKRFRRLWGSKGGNEHICEASWKTYNTVSWALKEWEGKAYIAGKRCRSSKGLESG